MQHAHQVHLTAILDISQIQHILNAIHQQKLTLQNALPANIMVVHMAVVKIAHQTIIAQEVNLIVLRVPEK